ncbi:MAG: hypothetical protein OXI63_12920 [Candidatus Poribacteria bacterium]|nr:hypothetical protein [Candidatus Poribacteria bacterium]
MPTSEFAASAEITQLLEQIKTGIVNANAKLKTGIIEFSITLSQATRAEGEDQYQHEETGRWHILYRFDGEHHFYDVKVHNKMELNGKPLDDWQNNRFQYQMDMDKKTLLFQEYTGTGWKRHPVQSIPSRDFRLYYTLHWWIWPHWEPKHSKLTELLHLDNVADVKEDRVADTSNYQITLKRTVSGLKLTSEISLDVQKDYRPTRVFVHIHNEGTIPLQPEGPPGSAIPSQTLKEYRVTSWTYQLKKFKPDVWYPSRITRENSFVTEIEDEKQQPKMPPILRKATLQVHRAVFNIPIAKEDLYIRGDE